MPFNVIAFSCTIIAFAFGSIFNLLYKSMEAIDKRRRADKLRTLLEKIAIKLRLCDRKNEDEPGNEDDRKNEEEHGNEDSVKKKKERW